MTNIHAYTEPTPERGVPAYVSVNKHPDGRHTLTVRSRAVFPGSQQPAQIELSLEQLGALAVDVLKYYNEAA